jgi:NodT family efflux transporter outer membrane factor (OMF) lipoprotein
VISSFRFGLFRSGFRLAMLASTALVMSGCMVGPNFKRPETPNTDAYLPVQPPQDFVASGIAGGEAQSIVQNLDIPAKWWEVFQSRPINSLIEQSLIANPDIQAAAAALRVAQANARAQRGQFFPTIGLNGGASANQVPDSLQSPTASGQQQYALYTAGVTVNYTVDAFGGMRRQVESLDALAEQQCFQLEATYLTLASNVVTAALTEAALRAQIEAVQRIIAAQRQTLDILQRQTGLGAIPGGDVATQQAALAQVEASLPPLQKAMAQQRNLLATLSGRPPSQALAERFDLNDIKLPHELPLSLPSKLVEQRPDVRAAEANVHSASALVGVAVANQLPQITLNSGVATSALALGSLFGPGLIATTIGASILQTVIDGGTLEAKKKAAYAGLDQADAQYRSTVLTAFRNVADTLRALEFDALALQATVNAERAAATSLDIARRRLDLGDTTYVFVLSAELLYQQAALARVQALANRYMDTAALFQALGGGWWNRNLEIPEAERLRCRPPPAPGKRIAEAR